MTTGIIYKVHTAQRERERERAHKLLSLYILDNSNDDDEEM